MKKFIFKYPIFCIAIGILILYAPLFSGLFSPKNDNIIYFLSTRFNISSAIQNGAIPFWSSNIYFGLPLHSDMQSGFWNPVVWFLSLFGKYNVSTLVVEIYIYLLIAGIGMYKLSKLFANETRNAILIALTYISCGFMVDVAGQNIAFLIAASYLPLIVYYFIKFLRSFKSKNILYFSVTYFLLLGSSYPSFTIIITYGLLFYFLITLFKSSNKAVILVQSFTLAAFTLLLCLPVLYSYWEYFTYYSRGNSGINYTMATSNSLTNTSLISFFAPLASAAKEGINTDAMMRNVFIGLFISIPLVHYKLIATKKNTLLIGSSIILLLLSLGNNTIIYSLFYHYFPLFNFFRHPANFRLLFLFIILLFCAYNNSLQSNSNTTKAVKIYLVIAASLLVSALLYSIFSKVSLQSFTMQHIFEQITIANGTIIQCLFFVVIYFLFYLFKVKNTFQNIQYALIFTFTITQSFKTVVSKTSNNAINTTIKKVQLESPTFIAIKTIGELSLKDSSQFDFIGNASYYKKHPSYSDRQVTPTINSTYTNWIAQPEYIDLLLKNKITGVYPLNINEDTIVNLNNVLFKDNDILLNLTSKKDTTIYITQNKHHNWQIKINNQTCQAISENNFPFIILPIKKGSGSIALHYKPLKVSQLTILCFSIYLVLIGYAIFATSRYKAN